MRDGHRSADQYDAMAAKYAADNAENAFHAHYERPATISILGEVEGRRVLEVGCGAGPLTAWLVDQVAEVGRAVVFSTHHPTMDWQLHCPDDYFVMEQVAETRSKGSQDFQVTFWRRPLTAMTEAIAAAGFVIERLIEPEPSGELRDRDPEAYALLSTKPQFLFFRLRPA